MCLEDETCFLFRGYIHRATLGIFLIAAFWIAASPAFADVRMASVFSSHMVVQRDQPLRVWGWAEKNEPVAVTFRGTTVATHADALGQWEADFPPEAAGGPFQIIVQGHNLITLDDVMAGDVWLASGQSNMEFPMTDLADAAKKIAAADCPAVRLFRVEHRASEYPLDDVQAQPWAVCGAGSAASFSAVAYYFARDISEREHVTVGVLESSWGGTLAESWTSLDALSADAGLMPVFAARAQMMDTQISRMLQQHADEAEKAAGRSTPSRPWNPLPEMWQPAALYNGMIAPLKRFPIRGVIWYQGESNSAIDRAPLYSRLFPALIRDWRQQWAQGDFPFLFVQISNFKSGSNEDWPTIRDAQRRTLSERDTAMVVTIDVGDPDNVHPRDKATVGSRLALAARAVAYSESVEYEGPLFRQISFAGPALRVWFDHAQGLRADGPTINGFEVAGADGKFVTADAHIDHDTVIVSNPAVVDPTSVRYDWSNSPAGNLFSGVGLPMSPFSSR